MNIVANATMFFRVFDLLYSEIRFPRSPNYNIKILLRINSSVTADFCIIVS